MITEVVVCVIFQITLLFSSLLNCRVVVVVEFNGGVVVVVVEFNGGGGGDGRRTSRDAYNV